MTTNKKTIMRKDILSGERYPRKELLRLVRFEGRIVIDASGQLPGRGAYIKNVGDIEKKLTTRMLSKAFRSPLDASNLAELLEEIRNNG